MARRIWQILITLTCLILASAMLSACTKRSGAPAATTSAPDGQAGGGRAGASAGAMAGLGGAADAGGAAGSSMRLAGMPIPALPSPSGFSEASALRDVHFDFDRYAIRPQDAKTLEDNARWLKGNARAIVLIEGHADERGTNEYNLALGERRATATREYLLALGIERSRITLLSYGEERPLCTERTESCWAENRRAHFLVQQP